MRLLDFQPAPPKASPAPNSHRELHRHLPLLNREEGEELKAALEQQALAPGLNTIFKRPLH